MDNAISLIQSWINKSPHKIKVINRVNHQYECDELLGITEHSVLGTIVNQVGGISIANNFIRHFGGENTYNLSIRVVNSIENQRPTMFQGVLIVADDIYGGLFAINLCLSDFKPGNILYLPPDKYNWEDLEIGHSDFVYWSMTEDVSLFFKTYSEQLKTNLQCDFDETYMVTPPLWIDAEKYKVTKTQSNRVHLIRNQIIKLLK